MPNARFSVTPLQVEDVSGLPYSTAVLWFTAPGTNTNRAIYDADGNALSNPVEADSEGRFPPVYGDSVALFRIRCFANDDTSGSPLWEIASETPGASGSSIATGLSGHVLGYLDENLTYSGNLTFSGNLTGSGTWTVTGAVTFSGATALPLGATVGGQRIGPREINLTQKNASYTLVLGDAGNGFYKDNTTGYAWTIPPNASVAFPIGTVIYFLNEGSAGVITVTRGSGVTLRLAGTAGPDDYEIAAYGEATITKVGTNAWVIRGTGIT